MDRRPEMRRTMTLSEQLSAPDPAIRDFLKIPHDDDDGEWRPSTLMNAIGRDGNDEGSPTATDAAGGGGMINWKPLRDRLRLRRAASAWSAPSPKPAAPAATNSAGSLSNSNSNSNSSHSNKYNYCPGEAAAAFSRTFSRAPSLRVTPTFSRATSTRVGPTSAFSSTRHAVVDDDEDDDYDEEEEKEEGSKDEAPAAQMSLMALLEQTDSQWDDDEEDAAAAGERKNAVGEDDEDDGEGREEEMVHVCCVCMVRHKGAAFIPCGHTFCRLCSRELWVSRGNCPLCNGFIQEILDIF